MDMSFALQALAVEDLVSRGGELGPGVHAGAGGDRSRGRAAEARVAGRRDRRADPRAGRVPELLGAAPHGEIEAAIARQPARR